jgi:hypothetical protein
MTSGPPVLRGEVSNEVVYDKVLEMAMSYLPPKPPQQWHQAQQPTCA